MCCTQYNLCQSQQGARHPPAGGLSFQVPSLNLDTYALPVEDQLHPTAQLCSAAGQLPARRYEVRARHSVINDTIEGVYKRRAAYRG